MPRVKVLESVAAYVNSGHSYLPERPQHQYVDQTSPTCCLLLVPLVRFRRISTFGGRCHVALSRLKACRFYMYVCILFFVQ